MTDILLRYSFALSTKFGFIDETQAWHCRAFLVWQDYCRYIQETTILTDEEQTDAFH